MTTQSLARHLLKVTWYVRPDGTLDEIDVKDWPIGLANELANSLKCSAFIRRTGYDHSLMQWRWSVYEASSDLKQGVVPIKDFMSEVIDQAHMYVLMRGMHHAPIRKS